MSDFGACKGCGRVYSLTRLKACPRCGDTEINIIEEVRIPSTAKRDLIYVIPETANESDLTNVIDSALPATTPCKNCGRDFRSDKLGSCPRCGYQDRISDSESNQSLNKFESGSESRCDSCSKSFPQAFDFCPSCGTKVKTSFEKQKVDRIVKPNIVETHIVKSQPQSIPLSEQRQAKNRRLKNLVVVTSSIFIILILGALVLKGISSGSPAPTRNDESVDSDQETSKNNSNSGYWKPFCITIEVPNPNYDGRVTDSRGSIQWPTIKTEQCSEVWVKE